MSCLIRPSQSRLTPVQLHFPMQPIFFYSLAKDMHCCQIFMVWEHQEKLCQMCIYELSKPTFLCVLRSRQDWEAVKARVTEIFSECYNCVVMLTVDIYRLLYLCFQRYCLATDVDVQLDRLASLCAYRKVRLAGVFTSTLLLSIHPSSAYYLLPDQNASWISKVVQMLIYLASSSK